MSLLRLTSRGRSAGGAGEYLRGRQHLRVGGGQLDSQRHAFQMVTQRGDGRERFRASGQTPTGRPAPGPRTTGHWQIPAGVPACLPIAAWAGAALHTRTRRTGSGADGWLSGRSGRAARPAAEGITARPLFRQMLKVVQDQQGVRGRQRVNDLIKGGDVGEGRDGARVSAMASRM